MEVLGSEGRTIQFFLHSSRWSLSTHTQKARVTKGRRRPGLPKASFPIASVSPWHPKNVCHFGIRTVKEKTELRHSPLNPGSLTICHTSATAKLQEPRRSGLRDRSLTQKGVRGTSHQACHNLSAT